MSQGRFRRVSNVVTRRVAGETVLVPLARSSSARQVPEFFVLNEVGEQLWKWLESPSDSDQLARKLIGEYDVSEEVARVDVQAFIDSLLEIHAVEPA